MAQEENFKDPGPRCGLIAMRHSTRGWDILVDAGRTFFQRARLGVSGIGINKLVDYFTDEWAGIRTEEIKNAHEIFKRDNVFKVSHKERILNQNIDSRKHRPPRRPQADLEDERNGFDEPIVDEAPAPKRRLVSVESPVP